MPSLSHLYRTSPHGARRLYLVITMPTNDIIKMLDRKIPDPSPQAGYPWLVAPSSILGLFAPVLFDNVLGGNLQRAVKVYGMEAWGGEKLDSVVDFRIPNLIDMR